jgi:hypothetical protein
LAYLIALLPHILLGLFAAQTLPVLLAMTAWEYVPLWLGTVVLGVLTWRNSVAIPLVMWFLFLLGLLLQKSPGTAQLLVAAGLVTGALVLSARHVGLWRTWRLVDWLVLGGVLAALFAALVGSPLISGEGIAWQAAAYSVLALGVWLAVTRTTAMALAPGVTRQLSRLVLLVLLLGSLAGAVRLGALFGLRAWGVQPQVRGDLDTLVALQHALDLSIGLGLDNVRTDLIFRLASAYAAQGDEAAAARALGLQSGFVDVIAIDAWEGPLGGDLQYHISCWRDLMLYPGRAQVVVYARGEPDYGIWPNMRVQLGEQVLGEVFVESDSLSPYSFDVQIQDRGRQRLTLTLNNDTANPDDNFDRSLHVAQAEIRYQQMRWQ